MKNKDLGFPFGTMQKIKIAFDVDGTLRCNCTETCQDAKGAEQNYACGVCGGDLTTIPHEHVQSGTGWQSPRSE